MSRTSAWMLALLAVSIPCSGAPPQAKPFRITGIAVSTRDGSPIARCRIIASAVSNNQIGTSRGSNQGQRPGFGSGGGRQQGGGMRGGSPATPPEVTTDGSGKFTLELPHAGAWRLSGSAHGFRGQNYDEHDGFYSAVVLTDAAPVFNLTFKFTPDSVLTGLIYDEAGEPVNSAQVTAELIPAPLPGAAKEAARPMPAGVGQTDDRGRYEIGGLAPGNYRVRVQAQPWYAAGQGALQLRVASAATNATPSPDPSLDLIYPVTYFPGTDDESAAETLKLMAGEEREADFHLTAMPAFHLRIPRPAAPEQTNGERGRQPMQQRPVTIARISDDQVSYMQPINPNGATTSEWDFGGLSPGTYEVRLPGSDPRQDGEVQQIEVRADGQTVVTMDQAKPTVKVTILTDGELNGDVEFVDTETGSRVASLGMADPRSRGFRRGDDEESDSPEQFEPRTRTMALPPHTYDLFLSGNPSGAYLTGITAKGGATVMGRTVTITGPATLTLHLASKRMQVEGAAKAEGQPTQGAMMLLVPATLGEAGDLHSVERDETNTDGTFLIAGVMPGQYILVAIDHGWDVDWRNPAVLAQYLVHGIPVDLTKAAKVQEDVEAIEP